MSRRIILVSLVLFFSGLALGLIAAQTIVAKISSVEVANAFVALGGLFVALIATLATIAQRLDVHRQSLYQAHLESYQVIYQATLDMIRPFLSVRKNPADDGVRSAFDTSSEKYYQLTRRYWIILPKTVRDALIAYEDVINAVDRELREDPHSDVSESGLAVANTSRTLFDIMREDLGIDRLHGETARLIGVPGEQAKESGVTTH